MKRWISRSLTNGEIQLGRKVFSDRIEWQRVRIIRNKAVFFQPREVTMAPDGNIWFHPESRLANCDEIEDLSKSCLTTRAHFIHELTHVYQHQHGVNLVLEKVLMFFQFGALGGYEYKLTALRKFCCYNIEQQACILADHYTACERRGEFPKIEMSLCE